MFLLNFPFYGKELLLRGITIQFLAHLCEQWPFDANLSILFSHYSFIMLIKSQNGKVFLREKTFSCFIFVDLEQL